MRYNPTEKPDPKVCAHQFCFFWQPANWQNKGKTFAERFYSTEGKCLCDFGVCTRLDPENGDHDWYEADEPDLKVVGLPWFYFYSSPDKLTETNGIRAKYTVESEALWDKEHWKTNDWTDEGGTTQTVTGK